MIPKVALALLSDKMLTLIDQPLPLLPPLCWYNSFDGTENMVVTQAGKALYVTFESMSLS